MSNINPLTEKLYTTCALCRKTDATERQKYRKENSGLISKQRKENRVKLKQVVLDTYGHVCAHCGENRKKLLTIDHIQNDGSIHRKLVGRSSESICKSVIKNYRPDKYQILCISCNWYKGMFGELPELSLCYEDIREG